MAQSGWRCLIRLTVRAAMSAPPLCTFVYTHARARAPGRVSVCLSNATKKQREIAGTASFHGLHIRDRRKEGTESGNC